MDIILILIALLFIIGMRPDFDGPHDGYLGRSTTATINGLFILLVMFSHFMTYLPGSGTWSKLTSIWMSTKGELIVATFLFFSGYGIMEQIKKRGHTYVDTFPVQRIFFVLAKFAAAITVFLLVAIATNRSLTLKQIILSYFGLSTLGNSGWYIFAILLMYSLTYFAFKLCRANSKIAFAIVAITAIIYSIIAYNALPEYYFVTIMCYPAGMLLSLNKSTFDHQIGNLWVTYLSSFVFIGIIFCGSYLLCAKTYGITHIILYEIAAIAFALLFVLLVMKFSLKNPVLQYMGGNAMFSIYVLQRLPMSFGAQTSLLGHPIMFFLFVFATTIILGWLFDQAIDRTLRRLIHKQ